MKNNPNSAHFGQNTRIFEVKAAYLYVKHGLWLSMPTHKGYVWAWAFGVTCSDVKNLSLSFNFIRNGSYLLLKTNATKKSVRFLVPKPSQNKKGKNLAASKMASFSQLTVVKKTLILVQLENFSALLISIQINAKLWNQVPSLDHFVFQNSGDFLC